MRYVPGHIDFALAALIVILMAVEVFVFYGLFRDSARGTPRDSRLPAYTYMIAYQWGLVLCVIGLWIAQSREWNWILLGRPNTLVFAIGLVLAAAYVYLSNRQTQALANHPELWPRVRKQLAEFEPLAPHTPRERSAWILTAITAGCCEEILFRGFLLAFVAYFIGIIGSIAVNMLLFGLFHSYYSWKAALKTAALGLFLAVLAVWSASVIPGIIIHAMIDLMSGVLAYRVLTSPDANRTPAADPTS